MFAENRKNMLHMIARKEIVERKACSPRKRRQGGDLFVACAPEKCLPARMSRRKGRMPLRAAFREMDLIALIIFNGRRNGEKVHVENVERSTESRGGFRKNRDKLHSFGELASIVYRIATEPLLNPIRS